MLVSVAWMTMFGALSVYITPEREAYGIAFAFFSASGFGYAQYFSITSIQFGASQEELGISGGLAEVSRTASKAIAATVFETILVSVQSKYAADRDDAALTESYVHGLRWVGKPATDSGRETDLI